MNTITKLIGVAAGTVAIGASVVLGFAYGLIVAVRNDDPQES